ncbi:MAG: hypothetical protein PHY48_17155, partial [Candidatus Cloacimonetes bacterium]|nr:hypothetical protein [Candidatus Cloacimonadota bacterium]
MKYYGILLIAILILLGGCDVKSPVLPKWDVDLAIPLINEKYYVSDLVDSVNILMDEDDVLYLTTTGDVSTPEFGLIPFTPPPSSIVSNQAIYHVPNLPNVSMPFVDQSGKVQFSYAEIATGAFQTKFAATAAGSSVLLHFDNIFHADGSNYEITAENSPNWVVWDLSGCHIGASGSDTIITELTISVTSNSTAPPGTKTGELSILANTPLQFQEFAGKLINTTMELQESLSSIVIEYPQGLNDAVTLESASIKMTLTSGIGFGADFSGQFYAYNDNGTTATVPIKDNQGNNFHIIPGANTLDVSESISDLLSIMPTHIEVRNGIFNIDSGTEVGSVRAGDAINLEYVVKAPFTFTLHNNPI